MAIPAAVVGAVSEWVRTVTALEAAVPTFEQTVEGWLSGRVHTKPPKMAATWAGELASAIAGLALARGPNEARRILPDPDTALDRVLQDLARHGGVAPTWQEIGFYLDLQNVLRCCSHPLTEAKQKAEQSFVEAALEISDPLPATQQHTLALAGFAVGRPDILVHATGVELPATVDPGRTFGVDFLGCLRYLAAADRDRVGPDAAAPSFEAMVEAFPLRRAAGLLDWTDLFYLARGYWTRFDGLPDRNVGHRLHERIRTGPPTPLPHREGGLPSPRRAGGGLLSGFGLGRPGFAWQAIELFDLDPQRGGTTVHLFADGDGWLQAVAPTRNCRIWRGPVSASRLLEVDKLLQEIDLRTLQGTIETGPLLPGMRVARIVLSTPAGEVSVSKSSAIKSPGFERWARKLGEIGNAISRERGTPWDNRADPRWRPHTPAS